MVKSYGWWWWWVVVAPGILLSAQGLGVVSFLYSLFYSQVPGPRSQIQGPRSKVPDPRSQVPDPKSQSQSLDNFVRSLIFLLFIEGFPKRLFVS